MDVGEPEAKFPREGGRFEWRTPKRDHSEAGTVKAGEGTVTGVCGACEFAFRIEDQSYRLLLGNRSAYSFSLHHVTIRVQLYASVCMDGGVGLHSLFMILVVEDGLGIFTTI